MIILSKQDLQLGKFTGDVIALDVNNTPRTFAINKTNVPDSEEYILAAAHGMTTWKDPVTGKTKKTNTEIECNVLFVLFDKTLY